MRTLKRYKISGKFTTEFIATDPDEAEIKARDCFTHYIDVTSLTVTELEPAGEPEELNDERGDR